MLLLGFGSLGSFVAMCMSMTMTAVGAGDEIIIPQGSYRTHSNGFLAGI